jgi:hypothetical protein
VFLGKKNGSGAWIRTKDNLKNQAQDSSNSLNGALKEDDKPSLTPDLSELVRLWHKLSEHDKSIILMIARKGVI